MPWLAPFADADLVFPGNLLPEKVAMPWLAPFADA